ncbi:hypothetical protein KFL_000910090 [Klebsormidium nitens]|uniref:Uncharacterized protein n=1 Tax=Klebsormidium nitens TaxID=105231 RepID=A0A1Y1HX97_KLENI|nr:hypothetical protein KFL_000910090 [Klebsormidium nitens]|eukprot:GAQ81789.1 hypothetical protein KFL_000910090 [Klebsormidium nitens]
MASNQSLAQRDGGGNLAALLLGSSTRAVRSIGIWRSLDTGRTTRSSVLKRDQVQSELDTLKRRRKGIEAALEKAGIPACLSSQHGKWPDSDVVDKYILDESMTVDEVIQSQQEHMLGGAARRPGPRTRGEAKSTAKREGQR